jgi:hypothetical protein
VNPTVNPLHYSRALGIDLRASQVEIACVTARWGRLRSIETTVCQAGANEATRLARVNALLKQKGWTDLPCLIALHGESTVLRSIPARTSDSAALEKLVDQELEKFTGLQTREMISGVTFIPAVDGHPRIVLALTRSEVAEDAADTAVQLGQRLAGLVPGAVALFNTWSRLGPPVEGCCLLIDAGQLLTEIVVCTQYEILFARSFNARLHASKPKEVQEWWIAFLACMDIYLGDGSTDLLKPEEVYLGGSQADPTMQRWIETNLKQPVSLIAEMEVAEPFSAAVSAPIATGLAMTGVHQAPVALSLLPREHKDKLCLQWQLQYWGMICGFLLVSLLGIYGLMHWSLSIKTDVLEAKKHQMRQMEKELQELSELEAANAALQNEITPLRIAIHNGEVMRTLFGNLAAAKHPDDWITRVADAQSYRAPLPATPIAQPSLSEGLELQQVIVEGYTPIDDLSTVNRMIEALRQMDDILEVDLLGDERLRMDPARDARWFPFNARLFAIEISVKPS